MSLITISEQAVRLPPQHEDYEHQPTQVNERLARCILPTHPVGLPHTLPVHPESPDAATNGHHTSPILFEADFTPCIEWAKSNFPDPTPFIRFIHSYGDYILEERRRHAELARCTANIKIRRAQREGHTLPSSASLPLDDWKPTALTDYHGRALLKRIVNEYEEELREGSRQASRCSVEGSRVLHSDTPSPPVSASASHGAPVKQPSVSSSITTTVRRQGTSTSVMQANSTVLTDPCSTGSLPSQHILPATNESVSRAPKRKPRYDGLECPQPPSMTEEQLVQFLSTLPSNSVATRNRPTDCTFGNKTSSCVVEDTRSEPPPATRNALHLVGVPGVIASNINKTAIQRPSASAPRGAATVVAIDTPQGSCTQGNGNRVSSAIGTGGNVALKGCLPANSTTCVMRVPVSSARSTAHPSTSMPSTMRIVASSRGNIQSRERRITSAAPTTDHGRDAAVSSAEPFPAQATLENDSDAGRDALNRRHALSACHSAHEHDMGTPEHTRLNPELSAHGTGRFSPRTSRDVFSSTSMPDVSEYPPTQPSRQRDYPTVDSHATAENAPADSPNIPSRSPAPPHGGEDILDVEPSQGLHRVAAPPGTSAEGGDGGMTDLDVLIARINLRNDPEYTDLTRLSEFLGPARVPPRIDMPEGVIEVVSRRILRDGRVKLKLSLLGTSVRNCSVCLSQFRNAQRAVVIQPCMHAAHADCARRWFRESPTCPVCRHDLRHE